MKTLLFVLLAGVLVCLLLWFKNVWSTMNERKRTVDLAAQQVQIFHAISADFESVPIDRSEEIYRQAVGLYMKEYEKPENHFPAMVLGFHPIVETEISALQRKKV